MNIVGISGLGPENSFVLQQLHAIQPVCCIIQPVHRKGLGQAQLSKLIKNPTKTVWRQLQKPFYDWHARRLDKDVANVLFGQSEAPPLDIPIRSLARDEINSPATAEIIRQCQPDVMVTSGCPLLKRDIFQIPRLGTINIHWGIAPNYRGEDTLFWPLYFGDHDNFGVTIHQIDAGIDTGPILAHGFPELEPGDTDATLKAKCAQLAASLLPDVLAAVEQTQSVTGMSPQGRGRLFCGRDRSLRHEMAYWIWRKFGRRTLPRTTSRRRIYVDGLRSENQIDSACHPTEVAVEDLNGAAHDLCVRR